MEIKKEKNGTELTLALAGRLDAATAPELDACVKQEIAGITALTLDFSSLEYIASAGLRVLLVAEKLMRKQGKMTLVHVNPNVREVLDMTGFLQFLNVEE